jgi:hypothetical protein
VGSADDHGWTVLLDSRRPGPGVSRGKLLDRLPGDDHLDVTAQRGGVRGEVDPQTLLGAWPWAIV